MMKTIALVFLAFMVTLACCQQQQDVVTSKITVHPNAGAFEGGPSGTVEDTKINNVISESAQVERSLFEFDMPSSGPPSPLFGAQPFTAPFLRFEEFGNKAFPTSFDAGARMPAPASTTSYPDGAALDAFLSGQLGPEPTEEANTGAQNPWKSMIEQYIGKSNTRMPLEGRPAGANWAHQRWNEFPPRQYFQTATTGARSNTGLRTPLQSHGYAAGTEFGPGGLYSAQPTGLEVKFHPSWPTQHPSSVWTFDGTFPPKLCMARYGEAVLHRHYNALPIDVTENRGFGVHTLTTHEHNGHTPAESDGYTNAFFFPGQFYDYRWPMVLAGHDTINTDASDKRAGGPDGNGGIRQVRGDYRQTMSTHWFHDHMLDFTAHNVYKGDVAMMNYYSAIDRGNEAIDDGVNLRFPSGSALDWGNRDYDVDLMLADKAFDASGQLWFNPHNVMGFIGDVMTVNLQYKPTMEVRARRYRFRILDGSVSRFFKVALTTSTGAPVPFHMIANDGNIMEHSVYYADGILPVVGIAERYDIVVDFSGYAPGTRLYFVNMMSHKNGIGTDEVIPLADIFSGAHNPTISGGSYTADPVVGKFMELVVRAYSGTDRSMDPAMYTAGGKKMIPLHRPTELELNSATHRTFEFERNNEDDERPWGIGTDGQTTLGMDPHLLSAAPSKNANGVEVWRLINSGQWSHPIHIHFEEAIVLRRDGLPPPEHERWARKDVFRLGPDAESGTMVELVYRFREFSGTFMTHCHNTQHEDHAMLQRWDVENQGQLKLLAAPVPTWEGGSYEATRTEATFRSGEAGGGQVGPTITALQTWIKGITVGDMDFNTVRIGDAIHQTDDERGWVQFNLRKGINVKDGVSTTVYFILHDCSDKLLADKFGIAFAGALANTPDAATGPATYNAATDTFTFFGDLPNPVSRLPVHNADEPGIPAASADNTYTPLRRVTLDGKSVLINAFFIKWGDKQWEQLRIDDQCVLPDHPANTACMYNGPVWGLNTGHMLAIDTEAAQPWCRLKLHKSWTENGDYLPYYIVVDSHPKGTADAMGIIWVPKHAHLASAAVPLVQFIPPQPLHSSYPPTPSDGFGLAGGGPLGGQIGLPSYFMPGKDYSPYWHIGFAHWEGPADRVVKGLDEVKFLRKQGKIKITELPPTNIVDDYDFNSLNSPHVVNCPTPITIDHQLHVARAIHDKISAAHSSDSSGNEWVAAVVVGTIAGVALIAVIVYCVVKPPAPASKSAPADVGQAAKAPAAEGDIPAPLPAMSISDTTHVYHPTQAVV